MVNLKTIRLPVSANIKLALVAFAFAIVAGTLFYTNRLANDMRASQRNTVRFYATMLQTAANAEMPSQDLTGLTYDLTGIIDFPMIYTGKDSLPSVRTYPDGKVSYKEFVKNVDLDETASPQEQLRSLKEHMREMASVYPPLAVYTITNHDASRDSTVIAYIFYDDSRLVKQLQALPLIGIVIITMLVLVGYISFSYIKRNEQSNIWVGMAKETAHQLGTPLSSLLGWVELLRYAPEDTEQVLEAAAEMERDVERLSKIAHRFSKIGSAAEVRTVELNGVLRNVITYFERRLPHLGRKVSLALHESTEPVYVAINVDLFEWVFENLVRNAADAIDHAEGTITLRVHEVRNTAIIDVMDNGRGIDPKIKKDIFRPGFSTKQRGWGLGLSLAKRIVEDYHGGKIVVKQSTSSGTTFRIRVPSVTAPAPAPAVQASVETSNA